MNFPFLSNMGFSVIVISKKCYPKFVLSKNFVQFPNFSKANSAQLFTTCFTFYNFLNCVPRKNVNMIC